MGNYSTFLFAQPSFLEGFARAADVAGTLDDYNFSDTGLEADYRALWADWMAIGLDMKLATAATTDSAEPEE